MCVTPLLVLLDPIGVRCIRQLGNPASAFPSSFVNTHRTNKLTKIISRWSIFSFLDGLFRIYSGGPNIFRGNAIPLTSGRTRNFAYKLRSI